MDKCEQNTFCMFRDIGFLVSTYLTEKKGPFLYFYLSEMHLVKKSIVLLESGRMRMCGHKKRLHNSTTLILGTWLQILFQKKD